MSARAYPAALCGLIALALALRAVGLDFGVPVWEEPDAVIAMHVEHLREGSGRGDRRWSDQNYPHLIARLTEPLPGPAAEEAAPRTVAQHLAAAARTHVQVRWVVAWVSVLAVPGTWWLARRFLGPPAALFSAALVATSLLHFSFSQQGRPHAAAGGLFVLAVVAAMRLVRRARLRDHLLAGALAGLSLGVLQSGVFVLPPLALGFALRTGARGRARLLAPPALLHLALLAAAVVAFYPFLFGGGLGGGSGGPELEGERLTLAEHSVALSDFLDGGGFRVLWLSLLHYDPLLLFAGLLGAAGALLLRRPAAGPERAARRAELAVALAFALPYLLVLGLFEKTYERFAIPALPFLACAAGAGLERLLAGRGAAARRALAAAAALLLLVPAAACAKLAWLRSRPDTLDLAARWIEEHLERDDPIALPAAPRVSVAFDLPLWRRPEAFETERKKRVKQHSPWSRYQAALAARAGGGGEPPGWNLRWLVPEDSAEAELLSRDYRAFILSLSPGYYVIEPFEERYDHERLVELRRILAERGVLAARFTPEGPQGKIEWDLFYMLSDHFNAGGYEHWPYLLPRLFRADAIGPAVEIYRVDQGP